MRTQIKIAYFITPHGFGHAARASAVMAALLEKNPNFHFDIFTLVPKWFFDYTLAGHFDYFSYETDVGMVQSNSLTEDLPATVQKLDGLLPFCVPCIGGLVTQIKLDKCELVLCDIAPMGIVVAQAAGIPSILIENFTWDWIYEGYLEQSPDLAPHIKYLKKIFSEADYLIQTHPFCETKLADLTASPISRQIKTPATEIRQALGIPLDAKIVLLTMGGTHWDYTFLAQLKLQKDIYFIIPGAVSDEAVIRDNLVLLPHSSPYFHPDLINAADAVIGKVGYSTLAEIYQAGIPFGYVTRDQFSESAILVDFVQREMTGIEITPSEFANGDWVSKLPQLLALPKMIGNRPNGADDVSTFVMDVLKNIV